MTNPPSIPLPGEKGDHHFATLRAFADNMVEESISRAKSMWAPGPRRAHLDFERDFASILRGAGIVSLIAYVEEQVGAKHPVPWPVPRSIPNLSGLPKRVSNLDYWGSILDAGWYGWTEFSIFHRLRHCFGHRSGRLLDGQEVHIRRFQQRLASRQVVDRLGKSVDTYYDLQVQSGTADRILLRSNALNRCRIMCLEFLIMAGLADNGLSAPPSGTGA